MSILGFGFKFNRENFTKIADQDLTSVAAQCAENGGSSALETLIELRSEKSYFSSLLAAMNRAGTSDDRKDIAEFVLAYTIRNGAIDSPLSRSTSTVTNLLRDIESSLNNSMLRKAHDILNPEA